jgi:hypothetical protein
MCDAKAAITDIEMMNAQIVAGKTIVPTRCYLGEQTM